MGVAREYTVAQALKILNESEGFLVRNFNRRFHRRGESGGHAFSNHLVTAGREGKNKAPGPQAGYDFIRDRFLGQPGQVSSGWWMKGDMAVRLTELLNSDVGQEGLRLLDQGVKRVVIHYLNRNVMEVDVGGINLFDPTHMSVSYRVVPPQRVLVRRGRRLVPTTQPGYVKPIVNDTDVVGIHAVLERYGREGLHVHTLYPSFYLDSECVEYEIGTTRWHSFQLRNGQFGRRRR